MANHFFYKDKLIWKCSNLFLDSVYDLLKTAYIQSKSKNNIIFDLIQQLDQNTYGTGLIHVELNDFIQTNEDKNEFLFLLKQITKHAKETYQWTDHLYNHVIDFYKKIEQLPL